MVIFFYAYMVAVALDILLVSNLVPISGSWYKYFAAAHVAALTTAFSILMCNGFVGFQLVEDGTVISVWVRSNFLRSNTSLDVPNSGHRIRCSYLLFKSCNLYELCWNEQK